MFFCELSYYDVTPSEGLVLLLSKIIFFIQKSRSKSFCSLEDNFVSVYDCLGGKRKARTDSPKESKRAKTESKSG